MNRTATASLIKPPVTWILVADARQAQVFTRQKVTRAVPLKSSARRYPVQNKSSYEAMPLTGMKMLADEKSAKALESVKSARHSEPEVTAGEEIRDSFARDVAARINAQEKKFDQLVLVAPAKTVGALKKYLKPAVLKRVVAELHKDLTHYQGEALTKHLNGIGAGSQF